MKVTCNKTDGRTPKVQGGLLRLGLPMGLTLTAGEDRMLSLGVSFDVPVLLCQSDLVLSQGVELLNKGDLVMPGQDVKVVLRNHSGAGSLFEVGDTVCVVVPIGGEVELA